MGYILDIKFTCQQCGTVYIKANSSENLVAQLKELHDEEEFDYTEDSIAFDEDQSTEVTKYCKINIPRRGEVREYITTSGDPNSYDPGEEDFEVLDFDWTYLESPEVVEVVETVEANLLNKIQWGEKEYVEWEVLGSDWDEISDEEDAEYWEEEGDSSQRDEAHYYRSNLSVEEFINFHTENHISDSCSLFKRNILSQGASFISGVRRGLGDEQAIELFLGMLDTWDEEEEPEDEEEEPEMEEFRYWLIDALVQIGAPTVPALQEAIKSDDMLLRRSAQIALDKLRDTSSE